MSKNGVRSIVKKFEATKIMTIKTGRGKKHNISRVLERKLVQTANQNPRVTAATFVSDAVNSRVTVLKKTIAQNLKQKWASFSQTTKDSASKEETSKSQI